MQNILFVTRKYPPVKGGMEQYSFGLYTALKQAGLKIDLLANRKGNSYLPFFLIKAVIKIAFAGLHYSHIHFGDGLLAPVAIFARLITNAGISITVHGLDVTYDRFFYQSLIPPCIRIIPVIICDSQYGFQECVKRGVPEANCHIIPIGIDIAKRFTGSIMNRNDLFSKIGINGADRKVLLSAGRLVPRKGFVWFVENVMPLLDDEYIYIVCGDGPQKQLLQDTVSKNHLMNRVFILGNTSDEILFSFYRHCSLFVMPNIPTPNDPEGFGIVILEAASQGATVFASRLEGITDALLEGRNGFFAESGNAKEFSNKIMLLANSPPLQKKQVIQDTLNHFSWPKIAMRYKADIFT